MPQTHAFATSLKSRFIRSYSFQKGRPYRDIKKKKIIKLMVREVATDTGEPQIRAFLWKVCNSWKHHTSGAW